MFMKHSRQGSSKAQAWMQAGVCACCRNHKRFPAQGLKGPDFRIRWRGEHQG